MFGGNSSSHMLPVLLDDNRFEYQTNVPNNQLQLFGSVPCTVDPVNYLGNEQNTSIMLRPNKRSRESDDLQRQQKLQISLNYNICQDEADRSARMPKPNPVSTGLRLSYDDEERNSSVTSASGSMSGTPSILLSLGDNIRSELECQKQEFDQFIKVQEEQLARGLRELKQRHISSFLSNMEKGISKKLQEKEVELESMNRQNRELMERIKQVAAEAQNWHYRAKYNESMVTVLKTNLQQAISQGAEQGKEGFGDSEVDDAASCMDRNNHLGVVAGHGKGELRGLNEHLICKACRSREVSVLLMPCRHLCVCKSCDGLIRVCPICSGLKTASVEVYLS